MNKADTSTRFPTAVGYVISPLILPPLFFWWLAQGIAWPTEAVFKATAIAFVLLGLAPLILIVWLVISGEAKTLEVRDRTKRLPAFAWAIGFGLVAVVVSANVSFPQPSVLPALFAVFPINSLLLAAINTRTKISVHAASIAASASMSTWCAAVATIGPAFPIATAIATPIVMWSRVAAGAHTRNQVLLGMLFGVFLPLGELYLFSAVGWLNLG
jgi:hypothetical protein